MSPAGPAPPGAPGHPTVLHSLSAAVLLDLRGEIELVREARGGPVEWGGVYGQLVRLSGPWRLALTTPEGTFGLTDPRPEVSVQGALFESHHRFGSLDAVQRIAPLASLPGAMRALSLRSSGSAPVHVRVTSTLSPYLLPVLVEGIRPVSFEVETATEELRVRHRGFALSFRSDPVPSQLYIDRTPWPGGRHVGPVEEITSAHELLLPPGEPHEIRFCVIGGLERDLHGLLRELARPPLPDPVAEAAELRRAREEWEASTPEMSLPDAPELSRAYPLARAALRRLYSRPGDGLTGLVAGYPWYCALWCRDIAWMLPAVLWLGDLSWAERSIDSVLRFQALADLPVVGGELGELPMQISPGPIFLYGTSDTTLYYPALALQLVRHGFDPAALSSWAEPLSRAIAWGRRRTDPTTGLLRHGGEAAELAAATESLARVSYGIDAVDTTIWDSADRRDHALDVQTLWHSALTAFAELAGELPGAGAPDEAARLAERLARSIRELYLWPAESYLYDSIRAGTPVAKLRPNALRAVSAGLLDPATARSAVERAARADLTAPWGVRTLSSGDPEYSPEHYHGGQVWPIATAWAADAALSVGRTDLGLGYLRTLARMFLDEGGGANECYRGDRPEPFDSCFLLGLSVGPFLTVLFERLWGLRIDARLPALDVRPSFPADWRGATLERLRIGPGQADLSVDRGNLTVRWRGERALRVSTRASVVSVAPGGQGLVPIG